MAHPQSRLGTINHIQANTQQGETSKKPVPPTFEQLLRGGEPSRQTMEDDHINHIPHRKSISVLAKVKEKAKKWRHTLTTSTSSKKKHFDDGNTTPSWGVSLDDEDDDDAQHLGPPMYESEMGAQAGYKQTSMKHPRTVHVTPDRSHVVPTNVNISSNVSVSPSLKGNNIKDVQASPSPPPKPSNIKNVQDSPTPAANNDVQANPSPKPKNDVQANHSPHINNDVQANHSLKLLHHHQGVCPGSTPVQGTSSKGTKTISKTMVEKLGPAYATVSDATYVLASKLQILALSNHDTLKPEPETPKSAPAKVMLSHTAKSSHPGMPNTREGEVIAPALPTIATKQTQLEAEKTSPNSAPAAVEGGTYLPSASKQLWNKGVSVKEYIMQKFEPGEDEKALSQVISKAISPKKNDDDATVVEKVREVVTSLLQNQQSNSSQPNRSAYHSAQNSSSHIPSVSVTDEVTEAETLERLLQTN